MGALAAHYSVSFIGLFFLLLPGRVACGRASCARAARRLLFDASALSFVCEGGCGHDSAIMALGVARPRV